VFQMGSVSDGGWGGGGGTVHFFGPCNVLHTALIETQQAQLKAEVKIYRLSMLLGVSTVF